MLSGLVGLEPACWLMSLLQVPGGRVVGSSSLLSEGLSHAKTLGIDLRGTPTSSSSCAGTMLVRVNGCLFLGIGAAASWQMVLAKKRYCRWLSPRGLLGVTCNGPVVAGFGAVTALESGRTMSKPLGSDGRRPHKAACTGTETSAIWIGNWRFGPGLLFGGIDHEHGTCGDWPAGLRGHAG